MKEWAFFQYLYNSAFYLNGQGTYIAIYVDDLHIIKQNLFLIKELKVQLGSKFKTRYFGLKTHYLWMEVSQEEDIITVPQTVYID